MRRDARALAGYALLAVLLTWPLAARLTSAVPGLPGDNWQQYWNVWWVKRALLELHQSPFHTDALFHPAGADLHLHALNLVPVLMVLPLAAAFGLTVAYNAIGLLSFVLAGHGAYRLCLAAAVRGRPDRVPRAVHRAAFLGGAVFTFCAYHFFYLQGPLALASLQWLPYFAWQLLEAWRRPGVRAPVLAGGFFVCAALTDWFHALAALLFALAYVGWHLLASRGRALAGLRRVALALAGAGLVLLPVLAPALRAARAVDRPADALAVAMGLSGDLLGFLVPSRLHPFWGQAWIPVHQRLAGQGAVTTFLGLVPLALALVAARSVGRRTRFWLVAAGAFAVLSLGPVLQVGGRALPLPLPAALFFRLPFTDLLRSPARFVELASMCLAVSAALATLAILRRAHRRRRSAGLVALLLALAAIENLAVPYPLSPVEVPAAYATVAQGAGSGAVLEVPVTPPPGTASERMLFQTVHGRPVLGGNPSRGRSGLPLDLLPGFRELAALDPGPEDVVPVDDRGAAARATLSRYGVQTVLLQKGLLTPDTLARARAVTAVLFPHASPLADDDDVLAYRVPADDSASFLQLRGPDGWLPLEPMKDPPAGFPSHFRWMEERGGLRLHAAQAGTWRVEVAGWSFGQPRRLALLVDGRPVAEAALATHPARHRLAPFVAGPGWHELELRSLDGADAPSAEDRRRLSLAAAEIRLEAVPPLPDGARVALAQETYLGEGWSRPEGSFGRSFRWTDGARATLFLPRATDDATVLRLRLRPFLDPPQRPFQRLRVERHGLSLGEVELRGPATVRVVLEAGPAQGVDALTLHLPDAAAPSRPGEAGDARALGVAVEWLSLDRATRAASMTMGEPQPLPLVPAGGLRLEDDRAERGAWPGAAYLGPGWSESEGPRRWTDGTRADLVLGAGAPAILRMRLRPFVVPGRLPRQRVRIEQDGRPLTEAVLDDPLPSVQAIALSSRAQPRVVSLLLPDAAAPAALGVNTDRRRLAVSAEWFRLDAYPRLALDSELALGTAGAEPFLGRGWSQAEAMGPGQSFRPSDREAIAIKEERPDSLRSFRWTDGDEAELMLDAPVHAGALLELTMRAFVAPPGVPRQRVDVYAGDRLLAALDLRSPYVGTQTLVVPEGVLAGPSVLRFVLKDALRPAEKGLGHETRRLAVALHGLRLRPVPAQAPLSRLVLGRPEAAAFLGAGWSQAEDGRPPLRWTEGTRAELFFDLGGARPRVLQLRLRPLLAPPALARQRLGLRLNGRDVATLTLTDPAPAVYAVAMPADAFAAQNRLELVLPDAAAPAAVGLGPDPRQLGVAVYWLRFAPWF